MRYVDLSFPTLRRIVRVVVLAAVGSWFVSASSVTAAVWLAFLGSGKTEGWTTLFLLLCKVLSFPTRAAEGLLGPSVLVPHTPLEVLADFCTLHHETLLLTFFVILVAWPFVGMGRRLAGKFVSGHVK